MKLSDLPAVSRLQAKPWRMIENQYRNSTRKLVSNIVEQTILEDLLESYKPQSQHYSEAQKIGLDYLLATPFRYPQLQHGSRFGDRFSPSLWYGSMTIETVLAEVAYYRFRFMQDSPALQNNVIVSDHSAFQASIASDQAMQIEKIANADLLQAIVSPSSYEVSHQLGRLCREHHIECITYPSARDQHKGLNVGLFHPKVFNIKKPLSTHTQWKCRVENNTVEFVNQGLVKQPAFVFKKELFSINDRLPIP